MSVFFSKPSNLWCRYIVAAGAANFSRVGLAICLTSIYCSGARASEFLSTSSFLKEHGYQLVLAQTVKSTILIEAQKRSTKGMNAYFLMEAGTVEQLDGPLTKGKLSIDAQCSKLPAANLKLKNAKSPEASVDRGLFVILSKSTPQGVRWFAAKPVQDKLPKSCFSLKKWQKLGHVTVRQSTASDQRRFFFADLQIKGEGCDQVYGEEVTGVWDGHANSCSTVNSRRVDCDGEQMNDKELAMQDFLGVLELGSERWFVFTSVNYEAVGYIAVPLTDKLTFDKAKVYVSRPYGC